MLSGRENGRAEDKPRVRQLTGDALDDVSATRSFARTDRCSVAAATTRTLSTMQIFDALPPERKIPTACQINENVCSRSNDPTTTNNARPRLASLSARRNPKVSPNEHRVVRRAGQFLAERGATYGRSAMYSSPRRRSGNAEEIRSSFHLAPSKCAGPPNGRPFRLPRSTRNEERSSGVPRPGGARCHHSSHDDALDPFRARRAELSLGRHPNLFGAFINVFFVTSQHWTQTDVGLVSTPSGLLGIALQTPIGAAIDLTRAKRAVIVATMAAMSLAAIIILRPRPFGRSRWRRAFCRLPERLCAHGRGIDPRARNKGCAGGAARAQLGLRPWRQHRDRPRRRRRRHLFSQRVVFLMVPAFAALTSAAVLMIPPRQSITIGREISERTAPSAAAPG